MQTSTKPRVFTQAVSSADMIDGAFVVGDRYINALGDIQVYTPAGWKDESTIGSLANVSGSGVPLSSSMTKVSAIYADDGGVALGAGNYRVAEDRLLVATAIGATNTSVYGREGHVKAVADIAGTATVAGLWGYFEGGAGYTFSNVAGVNARVDVPATSTIAGGSNAAAFRAMNSDLGGTHTGKAAVIAVDTLTAGNYDFFAIFQSATQGGFQGSTTMGSQVDSLLIQRNGVTFKIPVYANS